MAHAILTRRQDDNWKIAFRNHYNGAVKRFYLPLTFVVVAAVVLGVAVWRKNALPPEARAAEFEFVLHPSFLEPGPAPKGSARRAVEVGNVQSQTQGIAQVRLWQATAQVGYKRDAMGHLTTLSVVPLSADAGSDGWNIWRHRHGYILARDLGYFWNTLGDYRQPIRDDQGERFDAFLKAVWSYWAVVGLEEVRLKGAPPPLVPPQPYRRTVKVALIDGKLARPAPVEFQINPWHVPLRVEMDVHSSTTTGILQMVDGFSWKFDMDDWRRRHGYRRTLFFGYQWLPGFPEPFPMTAATGRELDNLLHRTMEYWSEAVAAGVITELDLKIAASRHERRLVRPESAP